MYINNLDLYTNYTIFIHNCLHFAYNNVLKLQHTCRRLIRRHLKSHITDKIERCSQIELKYRDYIKLNELLLINSNTLDLLSIVNSIKTLVSSISGLASLSNY